MSDPDRKPADIVDVLDEASGRLVDEITWMERVARERDDVLDFRSGVYSATSHLRREFALEERDPLLVDERLVRNVTGHIQEALAASEDTEARYHLRQATQLLYAMAEEEP